MLEGDDPSLLRRAAEGDPAAFERFVRRWEGPLFRFLRHATGSATLADEARQRTLLAVHTHAAQWRGGSIPAWLFRIALRSAANLRAREKGSRHASLDEIAEPADASPTPEVTLRKSEEGLAAREAFAALPEGDRALLWLCVVEGISIEEAARALDAAPSTLRYRLERALRRLRSELHRIPSSLELKELP